VIVVSGGVVVLDVCVLVPVLEPVLVPILVMPILVSVLAREPLGAILKAVLKAVLKSILVPVLVTVLKTALNTASESVLNTILSILSMSILMSTLIIFTVVTHFLNILVTQPGTILALIHTQIHHVLCGIRVYWWFVVCDLMISSVKMGIFSVARNKRRQLVLWRV